MGSAELAETPSKLLALIFVLLSQPAETFTFFLQELQLPVVFQRSISKQGGFSGK